MGRRHHTRHTAHHSATCHFRNVHVAASPGPHAKTGNYVILGIMEYNYENLAGRPLAKN